MSLYSEENPVSNNVLKLDSGVAVGGNLFLQLPKLSIPEKMTAIVKSALTVKNVFIFVTGKFLTRIEGKLEIKGAANLFLFNTTGIEFGEYAFLDVGGSFIATTASGIVFADGTQFKLNDLSPSFTSSPLKRLQFNNLNSGCIKVVGTKHRLKINDLFFPVVIRNSSHGLRLKSNKTFALVAADIIIEGGTVLTESNTVELSSIKNGEVSLDVTNQDCMFNYETVNNFGDIRLQNQALIDASGVNTNSIKLRGRCLSLSEGSLILIQNEGDNPGGGLTIETSESLELSGHSPDVKVQTRLLSQTTKGGKGSNICISTKRLIVKDGATISTLTVSDAQAGSIHINVSESFELSGASVNDFRFFSSINSTSYSSGNTGNVNILTGSAIVADGGIIACGSLRKGDCGNLTITASESILLVGTNWHFVETSGIHSVTIGEGNCGDVTVNASHIKVQDSARISTSTSPKGAKLTINASESIEVSGWNPGYKESSRIAAASPSFMKQTKETISAPSAPNNELAEMIIKTKLLRLGNKGCLSIGSQPNIEEKMAIQADSIIVCDDESNIAVNPALIEKERAF